MLVLMVTQHMQLLQCKMKQQSCDLAGWTGIRNRRGGREVFTVITEIVVFVTLQDRNVSSTLVLSGLSHPILEENCNNVGMGRRLPTSSSA